MYLIIGLTQSDRDRDYSSFTDGWRPGAEQVCIGVTLPDDMPELSGHAWAEAVHVATNAPLHVIRTSRAASAVFDAVVNRPVTPEGLRSLSVGDTVLVGGHLWACERVGFLPAIEILLPGQRPLPDVPPQEVCEF